MAIDTQQKRMAAAGVARPWMRSHYPSSDINSSVRQSIGLGYFNSLTTPNLKFYVPLDEDADDDSFFAASGTAGSATNLDSSIYNCGKGSWYFDGSNDFTTNAILYPNADGYNLADSIFTVEGWVRFDSSPFLPQQALITKYENISDRRCWWMRRNATTLEFGYTTDGLNPTTVNILSSSITWEDDRWYHVAATRDSSDDLRIFLDGVIVATYNTSATIFVSDVELRLGVFSSNASFRHPLKGWLDEWRIYKDECLYTTNFVPTCGIVPRHLMAIGMHLGLK